MENNTNVAESEVKEVKASEVEQVNISVTSLKEHIDNKNKFIERLRSK